MKTKRIPIILVLLASILFIIAVLLVLTNKPNKIKNSTDNIKNNTSTNEIRDNVDEYLPNIKIEEENKDIITENKVTEDDVVSLFSNEELLINNNDETLRVKAKETFTNTVDFIFYDKEIKGYKFKELTTSAKLKVIKIALSIDNKIDKYFPDYKDDIKEKYNSIKGKLALKYLELTSTLCDDAGSATCNQAKEDFNSMKDSFNFTWELLKELASSGTKKIKNFYETWKDSE